jgi:hypothetical protein
MLIWICVVFRFCIRFFISILLLFTFLRPFEGMFLLVSFHVISTLMDIFF